MIEWITNPNWTDWQGWINLFCLVSTVLFVFMIIVRLVAERFNRR